MILFFIFYYYIILYYMTENIQISQKTKIKKYPKSINNRQCLGPCYETNTEILHPIFLRNIKNSEFKGKPFCPTDFYQIENEATGKKIDIDYDICYNPTQNKDSSTIESLLIFQSGFTKDVFLSLYYDINTFEEMCEWLEINKFYPLETKVRIVNAALNLFGDNLDYFDDSFVDFYIEYIKEKFIILFYKDIYEYIGTDKEKKEIFIVNKYKNNLKYDDLYVERINYLVEKFFNKTEVKKFLFKFLKSKNILFENYNDILYIIYKEHQIYIENLIKSMLETK
jgi:hypothetical protein